MIYPIVLIAATALFAAIAWRDLRFGICLIAAALPAYLLRFSVGPVPMTFLEVMILVVAAVWFYKRALPALPALPALIPAGWLLPMGLLLLAATIGVVVAPDRLSALGIWKAFYVEPMLLFVVIVDLIRRDGKTTNDLMKALAAGGLFVAAFAIVQKVLGVGIPIPWDVEGRVTSVFPYPNAVGLYLGPIVVMSSLLSLRGPQAKAIARAGLLRFARNDRWLFVSTAVLGFIAILLAQSEAAIAAVVATLFLAAVATKRFRKAAVAVLVVMTVVIATISPLRHYALDKLTFRDYSETVRLSQWTETVAMLKDHAIFGAGLNGYPTAMTPYHTAAQFEIFQYPHTLLLNIWVELGMLGLLAFGLLASCVARSPYSLAFFPLLETVLHASFDVPYFKNDLAAMTWILLAVVAATYAKNSRVHE